MLKKLFGLTSAKSPTKASGPPSFQPSSGMPGSVLPGDRDPLTPYYPPSDQGLPAHGLRDLLSSQADMIAKIKQGTGLGHADIERFVLPVIERYASYIHLLPATRDSHHRGAGGLFRLGLEVAFYALQASTGVIYAAHEDTERKRIAEQRWRYASMVSGMLMDVYRAMTHILVTDENGAEWPSYQIPLLEWLEQGGRSRYYVKWLPPTQVGGSELASNAFVISRILPDHCAQYLREGGPSVMPTLLAVVTGAVLPGDPVVLNQVVLSVRRKIIDRDAGMQPENYGRFTVGSHIEPHFVDAMRKLVRNGTWACNSKKARLWYGDDGLFLVWRAGANEIIDLLRASGVQGVPADRETLIEVLVRGGIVDAGTAGNPYREIMIPDSDKPLAVIKISKPELLFRDNEEAALPAPLAVALEKAAQKAVAKESIDDDGVIDIAPVAQPADAAPAPAPAISPAVTVPESRSNQAPAISPAPPSPSQSGRHMDSGGDGGDSRPLGDTTQLVLEQISGVAREVTIAVIDDFLKKRVPDEIFVSKELTTVVVTCQQLNSYGVDMSQIVREWERAGWIYTDPEHPGRKIMRVKRSGVQKEVFALQAPIAKALGMLKR